jgi:hypothetical protein
MTIVVSLIVMGCFGTLLVDAAWQGIDAWSALITASVSDGSQNATIVASFAPDPVTKGAQPIIALNLSSYSVMGSVYPSIYVGGRRSFVGWV